jgi:hypothetical protein
MQGCIRGHAGPIRGRCKSRIEYRGRGMKAGPVEIGTLLQNRNRYCVPIYQRHYVWTKDKQWEPFWQDIRTKAIERLSGRDRRFSHFMGAVVLESRGKPSVKQVPSFQVVDGQQRLTTFQIFLTAAKHFADALNYGTASANIQRYLLNSDPKLMEAPDVEVYKIWPTKADRELFIDIISSVGRDDLRSKYQMYWYKNEARDQISVHKSTPGLLGAYGYFYDRIKHSVETDDLLDDVNEAPEEAQVEHDDNDQNGVPPQLKLDAIWQSLLEEFKIVEIILPDSWLEHWPMMGNEQPNADQYAESLYTRQEDDTLLGKMTRRHRLKHCLGNLTLVTQSFNSTVSNCAFDTKKPEFREQSVLMLNKDIAKEKIWNEVKIEERGARLSKEALAIWPTPAAMVVGPEVS